MYHRIPFVITRVASANLLISPLVLHTSPLFALANRNPTGGRRSGIGDGHLYRNKSLRWVPAFACRRARHIRLSRRNCL